MQVTALILTFNEAPNIERTLDRLDWVDDIVIIDSFSTDETLAIARRFSRVRVFERRFDTFADQCNFGLRQITTPWVLSLDADYVLTNELELELRRLDPAPDVVGFFARFRYCVRGKPIRSSLYPPRMVLYRRELAAYRNDGHGHRVQVAGRSDWLSGAILHDDRKPFVRWLAAQDGYARLEVEKLRAKPAGRLRPQDRLRTYIIPAPFAVFIYTAFWKRLLLSGWPGWVYICERVVAELILSIHLAHARLRPANGQSHGGK